MQLLFDELEPFYKYNKQAKNPYHFQWIMQLWCDFEFNGIFLFNA